MTTKSFRRRGDLYAVLAAHRLVVRGTLKQQRLARQEAKAIELVQLLHGQRVRNSPTDPVIAWLPAIDQHLS